MDDSENDQQEWQNTGFVVKGLPVWFFDSALGKSGSVVSRL